MPNHKPTFAKFTPGRDRDLGWEQVMSKTNHPRKPKRERGIEALTAILHCKGGPMRDRRKRRANDARRHFTREEWF